MQLPRDEAQRLIYRGCARLAQAMKVTNIAPDAAQKWEDGALREARIILAAAVNGPLTDLVIPPLPLALIEVHKTLGKQRPMCPSDVYAPFEQASTSPWSVWMVDEDDVKMPSEISLGEPSTFWWTGLRDRRVSGNSLADLVTPPPPYSQSARIPVQATLPVNKPNGVPAVAANESKSAGPPVKRLPSDMDTQNASEHDVIIDNCLPSKRCHTDQSSDGKDELDDRFIYVPKCDRCKDQGLVCRVAQSKGDRLVACIPCRRRKFRCSAVRGPSRVTKQIDTSTMKEPPPTERSIVDIFRSRGAGSELAACPPSKRQRVFVEVLASTPARKAAYVPVHTAETQAGEQPKIGPPGGTERDDATCPGYTADSSVSQSGSMTATLTLTIDTPSAGSSVSATTTPTSTPAPGTETSGRVLVDKCIGTESQPQDLEFLKLLMSMIRDFILVHGNNQ